MVGLNSMDYDEAYDEFSAVEDAYSEADRMNRPIQLLLDVYRKYERKTPLADRVAQDREAQDWLDDYWAYVRYNEHGNESSIEEVGGFAGFAETFSNADEILDYLLYDDYDEIDRDARDLVDRLRAIAPRYGVVTKMNVKRGKVSQISKQFPFHTTVETLLDGRRVGLDESDCSNVWDIFDFTSESIEKVSGMFDWDELNNYIQNFVYESEHGDSDMKEFNLSIRLNIRRE